MADEIGFEDLEILYCDIMLSELMGFQSSESAAFFYGEIADRVFEREMLNGMFRSLPEAK